MRRHWTRGLVLTGLVAAFVLTQAAPVPAGLGGDDDDEPVGYTFGLNTRGELGACSFYEVDLESGELTQVNPAGTSVPCGDGLTFDEDGELYAYRQAPAAGAPAVELITIDLDDGGQHLVGVLPPVYVTVGGMTFDAEGDLWLYGQAGPGSQCPTAGPFSCLWEVDPDDAQSEFKGSVTGRLVLGLTADCEDVLAISLAVAAADGASAANGVGLPSELDEVNTSNAALEKITSTPKVVNPSGLDFDRDEDLWAVGGTPFNGAVPGATVYLIDPDDGSSKATRATLGGLPYGGILTGLAVDPISCEEPEPEPTPAPAPVVVQPVFTG